MFSRLAYLFYLSLVCFLLSILLLGLSAFGTAAKHATATGAEKLLRQKGT